jgi:hypothetical protein
VRLRGGVVNSVMTLGQRMERLGRVPGTAYFGVSFVSVADYVRAVEKSSTNSIFVLFASCAEFDSFPI